MIGTDMTGFVICSPVKQLTLFIKFPTDSATKEGEEN